MASTACRALIDQIGDHRQYVASVVRRRMDVRLARRLDVSDIVQEVQFEAVKRVVSRRCIWDVPLKRWLRTLACDQIAVACRRHLGAKKRSLLRERRPKGDFSSEFLASIPATDNTPSETYRSKQDCERVRLAIRQLSEVDRDVVQLQVYEKLSANEISELLGISATAVRQRMCRALVRLGSLLGSEATDG